MTAFNLTEAFNFVASVGDEGFDIVKGVIGDNISLAIVGAAGWIMGRSKEWNFLRSRDFLSETAYVRRFEIKKTNQKNPETGNHVYKFTAYAGDEIGLGKIFPETASKAMVKSLMKAVKLCPPDRSVVFSKLKHIYKKNKNRTNALVNAVDRDWTDFFQAWSFKNREFLGVQPDNEIFPILVKESEKLPHENSRSTLHVFMMEPCQMETGHYPDVRDIKFEKAEDSIYFELARQVAESNAKPENGFVGQICKIGLMNPPAAHAEHIKTGQIVSKISYNIGV